MTVKSLPTFKSAVQESTLKVLRSALEQAEKGQIEDVAVVARWTDGSMYLASSKAQHRFERLGHLAYSLVVLAVEQMKQEGEL
ncbi:MAG TPA: hypothetical protein VGG39_23420 [Polyangiaceae bacterium]